MWAIARPVDRTFPVAHESIALTFNIFALHCRRVLYKGCLNRAIFCAGPAFVSLRSPCLFIKNRMKTLQMREREIKVAIGFTEICY
ncbi:hypothetical protein D0A34_11915 [Microcoleus vaginatus PCC 9802]|uniref:hypothetical protein n=1 Tax=Microcoleus vaginatus TaxID=119532 RepID=UPI00030F2E71|nr:hypothetical protein D0A34_11915 [Microcoleus vaginatus PCC 9802]